MTQPAPDIQVKSGEVETPVGSAPIVSLLLLGFGGYLLWFGVKYWRGQGAAVWPSYPVKSILQGKGVPKNTAAAASSIQVTAFEQQIGQQIGGATGGSSSGGSGGGITGPQPSGTAQNMARMLLGQYGWAASEMGPLILLWTRESGWSPGARNSSSGAFGIAQALGHGTSCSAAPNGTNEYGPEYGLSCSQAQQANAGSALWQIRWGLGYIKSRYGSPAAAWAHETSAGWY